mgnify:CR=1 FL=1
MVIVTTSNIVLFCRFDDFQDTLLGLTCIQACVHPSTLVRCIVCVSLLTSILSRSYCIELVLWLHLFVSYYCFLDCINCNLFCKNISVILPLFFMQSHVAFSRNTNVSILRTYSFTFATGFVNCSSIQLLYLMSRVFCEPLSSCCSYETLS